MRETGRGSRVEGDFRGVIFSRLALGSNGRATQRVSLFQRYTRYKHRAGRMRLFISATENRYPPVSLAPAANISFGFAYPRENRVIPQIASGRSEALRRFFLWRLRPPVHRHRITMEQRETGRMRRVGRREREREHEWASLFKEYRIS